MSSSTPLQAASQSMPVFADPGATMSGGTPLIVAVSKSGITDEYHVLVKLQLLQAYDRTIFDLQQQLTHYRALLNVLLPKPLPSDELRLESTPLNAASVGLLDTIIEMKVANSPQLGMEETDEV